MMDRQNLLVRWMGDADITAGATLLAGVVWLTRRAWAARASSPSESG
jgi:hypothetical protein